MKKLSFIIFSALLLVGCNNANTSSSNGNSSSTTNTSSSTIKESSTTSSSVKGESSTTSSSIKEESSTTSSFTKLEGYIYDENDLLDIKNDLAGTYYLANDITLSSKWTTIGDLDNPFSGTIDGNGYSIKNMVIDSLLSVTTDISEYNSVGGFIGYLTGTINNLNIENCNIDIEDQIVEDEDPNYEYKIFVGGLVGVNDGTIKDCMASGNINLASSSEIARGRIGGLVGKNDGLVEGCSSSGNITSEFVDENVRAGGLVGASEGGTTKKSSSSTSINITNDAGKSIAGGLIGLVEFATVENCYATGDITVTSGKAATAGGLIGFIDATVSGTTTVAKSYATAKVSATATSKSSYAGGVIGDCEVSINGTAGLIGDVVIENCFYAGTNISSVAKNKAYGGMIISCVEGNDDDNDITIQNCWYLDGASLEINGESASKENNNGDLATSISDLLATVNFDSSIWNVSSSEVLPVLK